VSDHEHKGLETYAYNPGTVSPAAGPAEEKNERAPDSPIRRRPVKPLPAVPTEANGKIVVGLDLGARTQMATEAFASKGFEEDLPIPVAAEVKDLI
jgi:hypothetical protein